MRTLILGLSIFMSLPFVSGCSDAPVVAQQIRGHADLEIKEDALITVVYSRGTAVEEIHDARYVGRDADWLVLVVEGHRSFIPLKNVFRIDVGAK